MKFNIVTAGIGHRLIEADVLPSPRLLDEGTRRPVEAYRDGETDDFGSGQPDKKRGTWRVRDDKYDPPGTEYQTIMVEVVKEKNPWEA